MEDQVTNLRVFRAAETVAYYAGLNYLTSAERLMFETYLKAGFAVLDLVSCPSGSCHKLEAVVRCA